MTPLFRLLILALFAPLRGAGGLHVPGAGVPEPARGKCAAGGGADGHTAVSRKWPLKKETAANVQPVKNGSLSRPPKACRLLAAFSRLGAVGLSLLCPAD